MSSSPFRPPPASTTVSAPLVATPASRRGPALRRLKLNGVVLLAYNIIGRLEAYRSMKLLLMKVGAEAFGDGGRHARALARERIGYIGIAVRKE